jgi:hypothetical protein
MNTKIVGQLTPVISEKDQTSGERVTQQLHSVCGRLNALVERMENKLSMVARGQSPCKEEDCAVDRPMPPLLSEWRNALCEMDRSLNWMADILDRVEL